MKYHRKSIRLNGFDYAKHGYYFVTICCQDRKNIFGKIDQIKNNNVGVGLVPTLMENEMILNDVGTMIEKIVVEYFIKNKLIELDELIVMPDHIHMIIVIKNQFNNDVGAGLVPALNGNMETDVNINNNTGAGINTNTRATTRVAPTDEIMDKTLGTVIGELKSLTTNEYIKNVKQNNWPRFIKRLWQRNYFERIIRNEREYLGYKQYIKDNPKNYFKKSL